MGDESNEFHREVVRPKVTELLSPNPADYILDIACGIGAAFAYMAKGIGYTECYACNSGGHGWAEVNGKLYDPEWSKHSSKYSYFGMSYDEECDVPYKNALGDADWMHVKV